MAEEAAFTGEVEIEAEVEITQDDRSRLQKAFSAQGMTLLVETVRPTVKVSVKYEFKNSKFVESEFSSYWSWIDYQYVPRGKRKPLKLNTSTPEDKKIWQIAVNTIRSNLPQIVYFPTFLVDMPKRIYLTKIGTDEDAKNDYYFKILQNIAAVTDGNIDLNEHVVDRITEFKKGGRFRAVGKKSL